MSLYTNYKLMKKTRLLIIFAKNPEKGRVKTRLAQTVGDEKALRVYRKLLDYTLLVADSVNAEKQVWYSRFIPKDIEIEDDTDGYGFTKKLQHGNDLGERMHNAFKDAFSAGYREVAIIGSDCAELSAGLISESYEKLKKNDLVIGPSEDGGYYLLGMKKCYGQLFEGIQWSTPQVLPQTLEIAKKLDLAIHQLPELNDVDNEEDWQAAKEKL